MNTTDYLLNKYGSGTPGTPQVIPGMLRHNLYELFAELGFKVGCEVGLFRGRNAAQMFKGIPELKLFGVEPYADQPYSTRPKIPERYNRNKSMALGRMNKKNFILIEKFSEDAARDIPDNSLDFVYIDGDHSYDFVMQDIILWSRKVRKGGIIRGHDYLYDSNKVGRLAKVTQAINDYTRVHGIEFYTTSEGHTLKREISVHRGYG